MHFLPKAFCYLKLTYYFSFFKVSQVGQNNHVGSRFFKKSKANWLHKGVNSKYQSCNVMTISAGRIFNLFGQKIYILPLGWTPKMSKNQTCDKQYNNCIFGNHSFVHLSKCLHIQIPNLELPELLQLSVTKSRVLSTFDYILTAQGRA